MRLIFWSRCVIGRQIRKLCRKIVDGSSDHFLRCQLSASIEISFMLICIEIDHPGVSKVFDHEDHVKTKVVIKVSVIIIIINNNHLFHAIEELERTKISLSHTFASFFCRLAWTPHSEVIELFTTLITAFCNAVSLAKSANANFLFTFFVDSNTVFVSWVIFLYWAAAIKINKKQHIIY